MLRTQSGFAPILAVIIALMVGGIGIGVYTLKEQLNVKSKAANEVAVVVNKSPSLEEIEASNSANLSFKRNLDRVSALSEPVSSASAVKPARNVTLPDVATASARPVPTSKPTSNVFDYLRELGNKPTPAPTATAKPSAAPVAQGSNVYTDNTYKFRLTIPDGMEKRQNLAIDSSSSYGVEFRTIGWSSTNNMTPDHYQILMIYKKQNPVSNEEYIRLADFGFSPKVTTSTDTINGAPVVIITLDYTKTSIPNEGIVRHYFFHRGATSLQFLGVGGKTELIDKLVKTVEFF